MKNSRPQLVSLRDQAIELSGMGYYSKIEKDLIEINQRWADLVAKVKVNFRFIDYHPPNDENFFIT